jgi:glycosyltransferase involved in cell wall biosynthesis
MTAMLAAAERFSYRTVDVVTTTLPGSLPHMQARGLDPARWHFVPHGVDVEQWDGFTADVPAVHRAVVERLRQEGRMVVAYAGSHGHTNALEVLIEAARLAGRTAGVVLVGTGPEKARLERIAVDTGASNVHFLSSIPRSALKSFLELVDVAYIGRRDSRIYDSGVSPNKLMDYMLARRPVVHSVGKTNDLVAESGCGRSVPPEDPKAVAEAFEWMREIGPVERARLGCLGREYVAARFPYQKVAKDYLEAVCQT